MLITTGSQAAGETGGCASQEPLVPGDPALLETDSERIHSEERIHVGKNANVVDPVRK